MLRLLSALLIALLLGACATKATPDPVDPGPDPDGDGFITTKQLGAMIVLEGHVKDAPEGTPVISYAFANFQALPKASELPVDPLARVFDTCFVSETLVASLVASQASLTLPELPGLPLSAELPFVPTLPLVEGLEPANAGAELTLAFGSSVYTTLPRVDNAYTSQPLAGQVPGGLTVTIPGGDFPAFDNVALPENVPTFSLQTPSDTTALRSDTEFTWTADAGTFVLLFGSSDDARTRFTCYAKDDGVFTFPKSTAMATSEFAGKLEGAARLRYRSEFKNESLFMPMVGSLEVYPMLEGELP
jgi:hypothetical protein